MAKKKVVRSRSKVSGRKKRINIRLRAGMLGITLVVCLLLVTFVIKGRSLQAKISANEEKIAQLEEEITAEEARTGEIEELQDYMKSDEYVEKIAKEKIGLINDDEILFKENK